jgi:hypothetical protein
MSRQPPIFLYVVGLFLGVALIAIGAFKPSPLWDEPPLRFLREHLGDVVVFGALVGGGIALALQTSWRVIRYRAR